MSSGCLLLDSKRASWLVRVAAVGDQGLDLRTATHQERQGNGLEDEDGVHLVCLFVACLLLLLVVEDENENDKYRYVLRVIPVQ
jgi:hypothetical protein